MERIFVFDFDGTLTTKDTLIEFIKYTKGTFGLLWRLLVLLPRLVLMKLHLVDNGKTKERLFSMCFKGMAIDEFNDLCRRFAEDKKQSIIRKETYDKLLSALNGGSQVFIISASIDNWVKPFFHQELNVAGTQIEVADGKLTGRFITKNCYGQEKVNRLQEAVPDLKVNRSHYYITAYGDSRGDKEMLEYADEGHFVTPLTPNTSHLTPQLGEIVRFGIVGGTATLLQYGIYWLLIQFISDDASKGDAHLWSTVAMTVGYVISFVFNFFASTRFTFRVKANAKRGAGFLFSHIVNYTLQMLTLNLFMWMGIPKQWAPIPMFCICVPINFILVRFFLKR